MIEKEKIFNTTRVKLFLDDIDKNLSDKLIVYMIGGGAMCLRNLKDTTFDIDLIVLSKKEFDLLYFALKSAGYDVVDQELFKEAVYKNAVVVFQKGPSRIDVFIKNIVGMLDFSKRMVARAEVFEKKDNLKICLASNTDILLLKSLSDREKDLDDIESLLRENIDWQAIFKECDLQKREGVRWIFFVYEQLCRLENAMNVQIEWKNRVFNKCKELWKERPSDFMSDIENLEKHIPKQYLKDVGVEKNA